jgi:hypothetical protein
MKKLRAAPFKKANSILSPSTTRLSIRLKVVAHTEADAVKRAAAAKTAKKASEVAAGAGVAAVNVAKAEKFAAAARTQVSEKVEASLVKVAVESQAKGVAQDLHVVVLDPIAVLTLRMAKSLKALERQSPRAEPKALLLRLTKTKAEWIAQ